MEDALKFLQRLLFFQIVKAYVALAFTILSTAIALYTPFLVFEWIQVFQINDYLKWISLAFCCSFPWFAVYLFWTLNIAWGSRAGQLEDLTIILKLKKDSEFRNEDFASVFTLLRREGLFEKMKLVFPNILPKDVLKQDEIKKQE